MMQGRVFKPRLSRWITGMYWVILVFLGILLIGIPMAADLGFLGNLAFISLFSVIILVIIFVMFRAYRMRFTVTGSKVIVNGVFRKSIIDISDIKSVQKTPIPFGFRLFGASFLGGWYFLPGIGKAWVAMGNFKDGVLITTKQNRYYVITPSRPLEFIKTVKGKG